MNVDSSNVGVINERLKRKSLAISSLSNGSGSRREYESEVTVMSQDERKSVLRSLDPEVHPTISEHNNVHDISLDVGESHELKVSRSKGSGIEKGATQAFTEIKKLRTICENKELAPESITDQCKLTVRFTIDLIELVKSNIPSKDINIKDAQLLETTLTEIKTKVLKLIPAARSFHSNPYDFLSKQQFNQSSDDALFSIKELLQLVNLLLSGNNNNNNINNNNNVQKEVLLSAKRIANLFEKIKNVIEKELAKETINDLIAILVNETNHLFKLSVTSEKQLELKIKDSLVNVASNARYYNNNKTDSSLQSQFINSVSNFIDIISNFLLINFNINTSESNSIFSSVVSDLSSINYQHNDKINKDIANFNTTEKKIENLNKWNSVVPSGKSNNNNNNNNNNNFKTHPANIEEKKTISEKKVESKRNETTINENKEDLTKNIIELLRKQYSGFDNDLKKNDEKRQQTINLINKLIEESSNKTKNKMNLNKSDIESGQINKTEKDESVVELEELISNKYKIKDWNEYEIQIKTFTRNLTSKLKKQHTLSNSSNINNGNIDNKNNNNTIEEQICECVVNIGENTMDILVLIHQSIFPIAISKGQTNEPINLKESVESFKNNIKQAIVISRNWMSSNTNKKQPIHSNSSSDLNNNNNNNNYTINTNNTMNRTFTTSTGNINDKESQNLMKQLETLIMNTDKLPVKGELLQNINLAINDAKSNGISYYFNTKLKIEETLIYNVSNESNSLRILTVQLMTALTTLTTTVNNKDYCIINLIMSTIHNMIIKLQLLLNYHQTFIYMMTIEEQNSDKESKIKAIGENNKDIEVNVWGLDKYAIVRSKETNDFMGGTLNHLVLHLTSEQDSKFLSTFITMYKSFTTPHVLFEKLKQRYNIPKEVKLNESEATRIKIRVCVVIQEWLKNQFDDFDKELLEKLQEFITNTLEKDGRRGIADRLTKEIQNKSKERLFSKQNQLNIDPWVQLRIPEGTFNGLTLILNSTEIEIARQLTIIEFEVFVTIKPSELLNQSWNKNKEQYKSPHILSLIERSNNLSYWIASLILWNQKVNERVNVIVKMLQIANQLLLLNNFNSLMPFVAALNISSISRLKNTWSIIEKSYPQSMEIFQKIQQLFDPSQSYRNYRKAHYEATSNGACMPYLAVYLSDLTFAEDGNPDYIDDKNIINFAKREIICNIIRKIQLNQHPPYNFPIVQPLHTFLQQLPYFTEKDLYDLSLLREPRQPVDNT